MNTTTKTLVLILFLIALVYILLDLLPRLAQSLGWKIIRRSVRTEKRRSSLVNSFLQAKHPGKFFVLMIGAGLLRTIKTINHGAEFPDDKQYETFKYYGTQAIRDALDEIGEGI
ncbi:MAG: hypothetical protein ACI3WQ_02830 [Faecousia sp.]